MRFLIKTAFWLTLVLVLLPSGQPQQQAAASNQIDTLEALSAAGAALSDMRQFCSRQPAACAVGSQALAAVTDRAQAGAKMVYEYLTERTGPQAPVQTSRSDASSSELASQSTLTSEDRAPPWRGPAPRPEPSTRRPA